MDFARVETQGHSRSTQFTDDPVVKRHASTKALLRRGAMSRFDGVIRVKRSCRFVPFVRATNEYPVICAVDSLHRYNEGRVAVENREGMNSGFVVGQIFGGSSLAVGVESRKCDGRGGASVVRFCADRAPSDNAQSVLDVGRFSFSRRSRRTTGALG
jgi:hypothetical protein